MEGYISINERTPNIRKDEVFIIIPSLLSVKISRNADTQRAGRVRVLK